MAYQSWSVVFGEQPSASKWGILGTNDASFNDGTGIFGLKKDLLTTDSNPYKFRVRRSTAANTGNGAFAKIQFATEDFDTNNNYDSTTNHRYTAPVAGFYYFSAMMNVSSNVSQIISLYKNNSEIRRGAQVGTNAAWGTQVSDLIQLAASDYVEVFAYGGSTGNFNVSEVAFQPTFSGFLVSRT